MTKAKAKAKALKVSNAILSGLAGLASFVFSLAVFVNIHVLSQQVLASLVAGVFCLVISYIASERPNSRTVKALNALGDRLLAVEQGDLTSPAPEIVKNTLPDVASAVDALFAEVRTSIENAHALGMFDPVTSLPNRLHFRAEADKMLAARKSSELAAMLFVDLDRFKAVNDSLGHARGDQLLTMVANRLRIVVTAEGESEAAIRPLLARLAGDEFTIFFPNLAEADHAERMARRIALAISEPFELHGHSIDIGASVGVALCPEHGTNIESLMRSADIAMYRAKSLGGGRHVMFTDDLKAQYEAKVRTEKSLTNALQLGQFTLAVQPQLDLVTGDITGAEALLRWQHPDGVRLPESFMNVAESCGIIADIGDWVMEECAAILSQWQDEGTPRRLAFNISPRQLDRPDFFDRLRRIFDDADVPLDLIELEFTESTAMRVSREQLAQIAALRADGAHIVIDDFGTGYSNIARLRSMPLDRVKLDPSLVVDIDKDDQARDIVQAVITLVRSVGAEIVAEAIENSDQAEILRAMGVRTVQGFVFAEPMEVDAFFDWVANADRAVAHKG